MTECGDDRRPRESSFDAFPHYMLGTAASTIAHVTFLLLTAWLAATDGGAAAALGAVLVLGLAVRVLVAPLAGELAERVPAGSIVRCTRMGFACLTLTAAVILSMTHGWLACAALHLAAAVLLRMEQPAHRLLVGQCAARRPRTRAFAVNAAVFHLAELVGAGAALIGLFTAAGTILLVGIAVLILLSLLALPPAATEPEGADNRERPGWRQLITTVLSSPVVLFALLLPALPGLVEKVMVTSAPVVVAGLGAMALLVMVPAATAAVVALGMLRLNAPDAHLLPFGTGLVGVTLVITLAAAHVSGPATAGLTLLGGLGAARAAAGLTSVAWIQLHAPHGARGRLGAL